MDTSSRPLTRTGRELALARLLRERHSAVGTYELRHIGFSRSGIGRLVEREVLLPVSRGAYRSGFAAPTTQTHLRCALLSAGFRSALSRRSAAHAMGLIAFAPPLPEVVIPRRTGNTRRSDLRVYLAPDMLEEDVMVVNGLRCTTPRRTILDLAACTSSSADYRMLRRAIRQATTADRLLPADLAQTVKQRAPFRGCAVLRGLLDEHLPRTLVLRSNLEADFLELCRRSRIEIPETNALVLGYEVDMLWRRQRVYVEIDTFGYHGDVRAFEADRARDADLAAAGYRGIRITDRRLSDERSKVVRQTRALLAQATRAK